MSISLSEKQNIILGTIAAFIESIILQPTLYWKNARAQSMPFTLNPRLLYRGTSASVFNECQMMAVQFSSSAMIQKYLIKGGNKNEKYLQFVSSGLGGFMSSLLSSPIELIMIQQQRFGGSVVQNVQTVTRGGMLFRGLGLTAMRDSIYVIGMLGITPYIQTILRDQYHLSDTASGLYASLVGGVLAAVPSHPFDVVKTIVQGRSCTDPSVSWRSVVKSLGGTGLLRGCLWRTVNITATVYIANECRNHLSGPIARYT